MGSVLPRGKAGYEQARRAAVWNGRRPDRRPDLIVIADCEADVVDGVLLAKARGWQVGVRSGGHGWTGAHLLDGGLLLDLSQLTSISVDESAALGSVQPGVTGAMLDQVLLGHELFFPLAHCADVGVAGFLMSGGYGWNSRVVGPACFGIEAIEVVTADGELVWSDDDQNPDLIWAVRGGGPGFFGVVTRFHLRLHPRPAHLARSTQVYPATLAEELLRWTMEITPGLDPAVEVAVHGGERDGYDGRVLFLTGTAITSGDPDALLSVFEQSPLLDRALLRESAKPGSLRQFWADAAKTTPQGMRYAADNIWTGADPAELLPAVAPLFTSVPGPGSEVLWQVWGGGHRPVNAAWSIEAPWYLAIYASWAEKAKDEEMLAWVDSSMRGVAHLSAGSRFGDADPARRFDAPLSRAHLARMESLRAVHDPDGVFPGHLTN